jgi:hypothetical protein
VVAKPGAVERLAGLCAETLEEIRRTSFVTVRRSARLSACTELEHSDDLRVSNLRQYLEALGARRRVPIHLGRDDAA